MIKCPRRSPLDTACASVLWLLDNIANTNIGRPEIGSQGKCGAQCRHAKAEADLIDPSSAGQGFGTKLYSSNSSCKSESKSEVLRQRLFSLLVLGDKLSVIVTERLAGFQVALVFWMKTLWVSMGYDWLWQCVKSRTGLMVVNAKPTADSIFHMKKHLLIV